MGVGWRACNKDDMREDYYKLSVCFFYTPVKMTLCLSDENRSQYSHGQSTFSFENVFTHFVPLALP